VLVRPRPHGHSVPAELKDTPCVTSHRRHLHEPGGIETGRKSSRPPPPPSPRFLASPGPVIKAAAESQGGDNMHRSWRAFTRLLGVSLAVAAFAAVHGVSEYLIALSCRTSVVEGGVERDMTPEELVEVFLVGEALWAVPYGVVAGIVLYLP